VAGTPDAQGVGATDFNDVPTVRRAARRARVDPRVLRRAIARGELPATKLGERWLRVEWADVLAWLRSRRVRPTAHARERLAEVLAREARNTGP